jgi:hypothetical protein
MAWDRSMCGFVPVMSVDTPCAWFFYIIRRVGVRGTTLGRECFQARRGGEGPGGKEGKT